MQTLMHVNGVLSRDDVGDRGPRGLARRLLRRHFGCSCRLVVEAKLKLVVFRILSFFSDGVFGGLSSLWPESGVARMVT